MPPRPFSIHVPDADLDDLRGRLRRTRWPAALDGAGWDYGANIGYIRELCDYWRDSFDWRSKEAELNELPGFLCEVDGVDLHFWHVPSDDPEAIPLLLIHGWPGSMAEFVEMLRVLKAKESPGATFHLVVPSLPGFGFGGKPTERGWGITRIAAAFHKLMTEELGYPKYGVQGGDWGGIVSSKMASAYPESVVGAHLNFVIAPPPPELSEEDKAMVAQRDAFQAGETGYSNVQGTKPDSLTLAQSDSPAGLAAWIVEKFRTWSDCSG
ncbi:MAG TPA: epoxide hydrolase, partial [Tepidiformaceae bacterium]|nr:epoxide hydrolase [Tepidiformaceae bacterium]